MGMGSRLVVLIVGMAGVSPLAAKPPTTWAKPDVSLADYRQDAAACAGTSASTSVSITPDSARYLRQMSIATLIQLAEQFGLAPNSSALTSLTSFDQFQSETDVARRSYNFGANYVSVVRRDVRAELQASVDRCLTDRGYVEIALTPEQKHALDRLKPHSMERVAYLHAIGSDATLIDRQRVTPPPAR